MQVTKQGLERLQKEFETLTAERPDAVMHLKKARELGDLSENGYYKASRAKLSFIDSRLFHLKRILKTISIIEATSSEVVSIGCHVVIKNASTEKSYQIVGGIEANPSQGRLSNVSPIGKALLGKKVGDSVTISTPKGTTTYTIAKISL